jgi:ABC-type branched-subunit amino acid transport system substrate-binding protein
MSRHFLPVSRRRFLQSTTLGAAAAATEFLHVPAVLRAQGATVRIGVLHPVSGALSYSGQQGRIGAMMAIEEINAAGGIKALGGARIEAVLGDAQSTPEGGNAEVEKMNGAGVAAIVGGYASGICLAASQTAARYDLPYIVDVGVVDAIVTRGLKNTFRFGPGFGVIAKTALDNLVTLNEQADKAAKTIMIVHEDSAFGAGLAKLLNTQLPERGFQILETIAHPTPTRDFNNVALKIRAQNPDLVIPANYYNEYVLLARTMQQQRLQVRQGISRGGAIHHGLQSLVRSEEPEGARAEEEDRGKRGVLHLRGVHELFMRAASRRRARTRRECRPREDHRRAGKLNFCRPRHAVWSHQIRQRTEPRCGASQHPGAQ